MSDPSEFQEIIARAFDAPPVDWGYRALADGVSDARCCICGDLLTLGRPGEVRFGENAHLPIHEECHQARDGLSSKACRLSMIGYQFLVRATMEEPSGWKKRFLTEFVDEEGDNAGNCLIGHGIPWWNRDLGFRTLEELIRWSRWCFIHERDGPKFTYMNKAVPQWDEAKETWAEYKRCEHHSKTYGTFYSALYAEPRSRRGKTPRCTGDVLHRTAGRCGLCFDTIDTDGPRSEFSAASDHIYPDSKGGSEALENIQPTHICCNGSKSSISGGHAPLAWMLGRFALGRLSTANGMSDWPSLALNASEVTSKFSSRF